MSSTETAIAVCLSFGLLTNLICVVSLLLSLGIWSVGEGFGGPYKLGESTDVGTALVYALLSGVLLAIAAGRYYSVDQWLTRRLGRFAPAGKLPFELPSSMDAVRRQKEDVPYDSEQPLFPFGYGLTY